jgi:hypothetical protein
MIGYKQIKWDGITKECFLVLGVGVTKLLALSQAMKKMPMISILKPANNCTFLLVTAALTHIYM